MLKELQHIFQKNNQELQAAGVAGDFQVSDSLVLGSFLAIVGGFMDSYSYLMRDHVFANAQTGNLVLMGMHLAQGKFVEASHYLYPVSSFIIGIALAEMIRFRKHHLHWRQISVLVESILLFVVSFIPGNHDLLANLLTSLACGVQVESFRKIHGNNSATTMCIGNMRSATQNLVHYFQYKDHLYFKKSIIYFSVIAFFITGTIVGYASIYFLQKRAILICSFLLVIPYTLMFFTPPKKS